MRNNFKIGDKVYSIYEPNRVGRIIRVDNSYGKPVYTIRYSNGNEYANYGSAFRKA